MSIKNFIMNFDSFELLLKYELVHFDQYRSFQISQIRKNAEKSEIHQNSGLFKITPVIGKSCFMLNLKRNVLSPNFIPSKFLGNFANDISNHP